MLPTGGNECEEPHTVNLDLVPRVPVSVAMFHVASTGISSFSPCAGRASSASATSVTMAAKPVVKIAVSRWNR